ncbi:mariner Mos1 transposase [Trichonephila clavipes]|nr:mariner Mos1 transposase [Trichonephila clavipes]
MGTTRANGPSTEKPKNPDQIDRKAESLQLQDKAVYFLGSGETNLFYSLLKPVKTVNTDHYKQQLLNLNDAILEKREQYKKRQHKVIFLHGNAPSHRAKPTKDIVKALGWEPLAHATYSPDLAPSDYYLFASLGCTLADQRFTSYKNVKSWLDDWLASKDRLFFWRGIHKLLERWGKCVASDGYHLK